LNQPEYALLSGGGLAAWIESGAEASGLRTLCRRFPQTSGLMFVPVTALHKVLKALRQS
jgi:hypothetical protein